MIDDDVSAPGRKGCSPLLHIAAACGAPAAIGEFMVGLIERLLYPTVQPIDVARFRRTERASASCASRGEAVSTLTSWHHRGWLPCCGCGTRGQTFVSMQSGDTCSMSQAPRI